MIQKNQEERNETDWGMLISVRTRTLSVK